jgi:hypothetical protein
MPPYGKANRAQSAEAKGVILTVDGFNIRLTHLVAMFYSMNSIPMAIWGVRP